jgi:hypothetical protein
MRLSRDFGLELLNNEEVVETWGKKELMHFNCMQDCIKLMELLPCY